MEGDDMAKRKRASAGRRSAAPKPASSAPLPAVEPAVKSPERRDEEFMEIGGSPMPGVVLRQVLHGHTGYIGRIAWSPDGRYLASPSADRTVRIWDMETGESVAELKGHKHEVYCATWSPDGSKLASASPSYELVVWDTAGWKPSAHEDRGTPIASRFADISASPNGDALASADGYQWDWDLRRDKMATLPVFERDAPMWSCLAWSSDGALLARSRRNGVEVLDARTGRREASIEHSGEVYSVAWAPNRTLLASGSEYGSIRISSQEIVLEGHTGPIHCLSFSHDGALLASSSYDHTIRLWRTDTWQHVGTLRENSSRRWPKSGLAFHPHLLRLASLGEGERAIRVWDIDYSLLLLNQPAAASVRYTTAKLVLVGDSGVGKTGLGWRLAKGEFKEHESTHGQQFWVIRELGQQRTDGTECEAVLWDLAGQHVYRQIHSIFLENVDASLILFDPSNRQDPLKGVQFWLEQLKGKSQLPPSVLIGARVDRGAPVLSMQELAQFCRQRGIDGGYLSTSARSGDGLDKLLETVKALIPWERMTATVTTVTFKRIKGFVLELKEKPDRKSVLVLPEELRMLLQATDKDWQFTNAEMMTAVGHLENHGYVTVLKSSAGETYILLMPDLLVGLASSIVLLADKHPRELGSISETDLLQGRYAFEELKGLDAAEQQLLIDAAVLRFLEHNVCFRESLGNESLLIFPGLIKQKRPLQDDIPSVEDATYIVRGRVENLYAMLVVLLGYTPSFTRINQWQNQAQYEMGRNEICGFRVAEEREGEIEFVLYYGEGMPQAGRDSFQELFENFLYQRAVEVTRFQPVACRNGHRQERATVVNRLRDNKTFLFCAECGEKTDLPSLVRLQSIGMNVSPWLQREEAMARLRSTYEANLVRVKGYRRQWAAPACYISRIADQEGFAKKLAHDIVDAGVYVREDPSTVEDVDTVIVLDSPAYQAAWQRAATELKPDAALVKPRLSQGKRSSVNSILVDGQPAPQHELQSCQPGDFRDETHYVVSLFDLVLTLYAIPFQHAGFAPLREALHLQWEHTLSRHDRTEAGDASRKAEVEKADLTGLDTQEPGAMTETYTDFELHIAPGGRATANSGEGQVSADIRCTVPKDIQLTLKLIRKDQTDAELLKNLGQQLYDWLFTGPIHTHFHQTEASARKDRAKLRVRLRIEEERIARLPLEFLYRTVGGHFLAVNPDTALSRYINLPLPPGRVRQREGALHLLAIIADPTGQVRLPPEEWETMIRVALAKPLADGRIVLEIVSRATRKEIRKALLKQKPDIIQFVGHGAYKDGKGYLALVDEDTGGTWLVDDELFANVYMGHDDHLGLICLATCESAKSDDPQGFLGIAPQLVQRGVPAVVAMQYPIYIKTAKVFLEDFYTSVASRKPLDWSVQSARNAISLEFGLDNREFATPVLYMRAQDGVIL
jgi:small GTP-binding protein